MHLTRFTDYSLRVLVFLAAEPQRRATVAEIAERFGIKANHLTKVVHFLGRQGWVRTVRGKGGGLLLGCPAQQIVLGAVVRLTEGGEPPVECLAAAGPACTLAPVCRFSAVVRRAAQAFYAVLDQSTLADLVPSDGQAALADLLQLRVPRRRSAPALAGPGPAAHAGLAPVGHR